MAPFARLAIPETLLLLLLFPLSGLARATSCTPWSCPYQGDFSSKFESSVQRQGLLDEDQLRGLGPALQDAMESVGQNLPPGQSVSRKKRREMEREMARQIAEAVSAPADVISKGLEQAFMETAGSDGGAR